MLVQTDPSGNFASLGKKTHTVRTYMLYTVCKPVSTCTQKAGDIPDIYWHHSVCEKPVLKLIVYMCCA